MITIFPDDRRYLSNNSTGREDPHDAASPITSGNPERGMGSAPMLADILSHQWARTAEVLPPAATPVLYLRYASDTAADTLHCGHYDPRRQLFVEHGSGESMPQEAVLAWMMIPTLPARIYQDGWLMPPCRHSRTPYVTLD